MQRRSIAVSSLLVIGASLVGACSSKSSASVPAASTADAGACATECCELPQPNTSCSADAGTTCSYAVTCSEGLVLSRSTVCADGVWQSVNDCPAPGTVDSRGCPAAQPAPNSPCSPVDGGVLPSCVYTKACQARVCDGGDCEQVKESAPASCVNGVWQTTTLPPC